MLYVLQNLSLVDSEPGFINSTYSVPGAMLGTLYIVAYLVLTPILD